MSRIPKLPAALVAGILLMPGIACAAAQGQNGGTNQQTGVFSGVGNLWGGATRSAGAPPGCVPGEPCGRMAHKYGIAHQNGNPNPSHRWTQREIAGASR